MFIVMAFIVSKKDRLFLDSCVKAEFAFKCFTALSNKCSDQNVPDVCSTYLDH
jgi:hypothetical protein